MTPVVVTRRYERSTGDDRMVVVSVEPSAAVPNAWLVRLARGPALGQLVRGSVFGPFEATTLEAHVENVDAQLRAEGFAPVAHADLVAALRAADARTRARAAVAFGWRRDPSAVAALLEAASVAGSEITSIVDALGRIGDARGIPWARALASKKLLARRRSGVEALRNLRDVEGLATARKTGLERLPSGVREALDAIDPQSRAKDNIASMLGAIDASNPGQRGLIVDQIYEFGDPAHVAVARRALRHEDIGEPHVWRYAKSVWKRSMLRADFGTFARLSLAIERHSLASEGQRAELKSGLDGVVRKTLVFSRRTQRWAMRASWRHLRQLAKWQPSQYAVAAAEVLVRYRDGDAAEARGLRGPWAHAHLLHRVLWGQSARFAVDSRHLTFPFVSAAAAAAAGMPAAREEVLREEAFPELWDATPRAYIRLLVAGRQRDVLQFALAGLARHPSLVTQFTDSDLATMLGSTHRTVVDVALAEIERRFDPTSPSVSLLRALCSSIVPAALERGCDLARRSASVWAVEPGHLADILDASAATIRNLLASLAAAALRAASPDVRDRVAELALSRLRVDSDWPGHHAWAVVALGVAPNVAKRLSTVELLAWLDRGAIAAKIVAGHVLATRVDALDVVGIARLVTLASDDVAAVRVGAHAILRSAIDALRDAPGPLFELCESPWADTRDVAFRILRDEVDLMAFGMDALAALADSNRDDVQLVARELLLRRLDALDSDALIFRLSEHPRKPMRRFALEIIERSLRPGLVPLARLEDYFRALLLDTRPHAGVKRRAVAFLLQRGLADERQADLVARLFSTVVRTRTRADFDRIVGAIAMLQVRWPAVRTDVVTDRIVSNIAGRAG